MFYITISYNDETWTQTAATKEEAMAIKKQSRGADKVTISQKAPKAAAPVRHFDSEGRELVIIEERQNGYYLCRMVEPTCPEDFARFVPIASVTSR